jgi:hypothetical protein
MGLTKLLTKSLITARSRPSSSALASSMFSTTRGINPPAASFTQLALAELVECVGHGGEVESDFWCDELNIERHDLLLKSQQVSDEEKVGVGR